jgi:lipoate-protein ligase A
MPDRAIGFPRFAYQLINETLVEAVRNLGVLAVSVAAPGTPSRRPTSESPCFDDPAAGEVLAGERKLIGSAQVRMGGVLLQHGSIMLRRSPLLDALKARGVEGVEGSPAYLEVMLSEPPSIDTIVGSIVESWRARIGALAISELTRQEGARAESLALRYDDPAWTWKR